MSLDVVRAKIPKGNDRSLEADFTATATNFGSAVTDISWTIKTGDTIGTLGIPSTANGVSTVLLSTDTVIGLCTVEALATFADGQTASITFAIKVGN